MGVHMNKSEFQLFCDWAAAAIPKRQLHGAVQSRLRQLLAKEFPDNAAVAEVSAVKGGRNDLIHYWQDGKRAVFELFCSTSQVPQDLRLLEQADAHWKIAILLDVELRSDLAENYFRKKPESFPFLWLSQVMMPGKERDCLAKLRMLLTMPPLHIDPARPAVVQNAQAKDSIVAQTGHGDININQKKVVRPQFVREPGDISEEQAFEIKSRIEDLAKIDEQAGHGNTYGKWQNYFKNTFHLTSYKKLPAEQFDEAVQFLNQQRGRSLPKLRRTNNDEWRDRIYRAIWPLARELGMSHEQVHDFAFTELELKKPISSLKELGEQNLEHLRDKLRYLKRKRS
jgi:hypothetical protein